MAPKKANLFLNPKLKIKTKDDLMNNFLVKLFAILILPILNKFLYNKN